MQTKDAKKAGGTGRLQAQRSLAKAAEAEKLAKTALKQAHTAKLKWKQAKEAARQARKTAKQARKAAKAARKAALGKHGEAPAKTARRARGSTGS